VRRFVVNWIVIVVAVFIAAVLLPRRVTYASTADLAVFAVILGLLDAFILPILRVISFPLTLVTFGLFSLVLNALMFWLAASVEGHVTVAGFGWAFVAALIVSAVNLVIGRAL
jgi:putative membrane protein